MKSLDIDTLLKYLDGQLTDKEVQAVGKIIARNPHYADMLKGLSMLKTKRGSDKRVKKHLGKKTTTLKTTIFG